MVILFEAAQLFRGCPT